MRLISLRPALAALALLALAACGAPLPVDTSGAPVAVPNDNANPERTFQAVAQRMEPVVERECRRRAPDLNCDFVIYVDTRERRVPNAFQTLGEDGRPILGFTLALLQDVRNADELAFVFGHEAAHHIAGHLARQERNATLGAAVFGVLAAQAGGSDQSVRTAQELGAAVGARSYSKDFELEADELGTILTLTSGFDAVRGADYFNRIPDPGNRFLGTHPPNASRIEIVRQTAAGFNG